MFFANDSILGGLLPQINNRLFRSIGSLTTLTVATAKRTAVAVMVMRVFLTTLAFTQSERADA